MTDIVIPSTLNPKTVVVITLTSNNPTKAIVPANVTVPAGASSATFNITTTTTNKKLNASISASSGGVTKSATLTWCADRQRSS